MLDNITLIRCPLTVEAIDGRPLGSGYVSHITQELHLQTGALHREIIQFYVFHAPYIPVISGLPWLCKHDPQIFWRTNQIARWRDCCHSKCLVQVAPSPIRVITLPARRTSLNNLPSEYHDLSEAFSKINASKLPPHRASDCAIDLLPGSTPPKGRIFPLSQPESESMRKFTEEELTKGFIRPSMSTVSAGFFLLHEGRRTPTLH